MTTESRETQTTYKLTCTDCSFEATVEGDVHDALDVAESHQEKYGELQSQHFVNFELNGRG